MTRHAAHVAPTSRRLALIQGQAGQSGPSDPLAEAFLLAERAHTPRERLSALEQVRAATRLRMRGLDRPDEAERALLDDNVRQAEKAYRDAGNFDVATRALSGWREALMQRLDATPAGAIETALVVSLAEGVPMGPPTPVSMAPSHYWDGVPSRLRDAARYTVHRTIALRFGAIRPDVSLKVYEIATNTLAWAHEAPKRRPGWEEEI